MKLKTCFIIFSSLDSLVMIQSWLIMSHEARQTVLTSLLKSDTVQ